LPFKCKIILIKVPKYDNIVYNTDMYLDTSIILVVH